jgi:hypothetical protein
VAVGLKRFAQLSRNCAMSAAAMSSGSSSAAL